MRIIDLHQINPDAAWLQHAKAAEEAVRNGSKKPGDFSEIWSELKPMYAKLSAGKCWYCECRQERADNAIDHFRPKSKYPFLAFSPANFRYACTFCNSRRTNPETGETEGKGDFFPLFKHSPTAKAAEEVDQELPVLLDPCVAADAGLLDFLTDGKPRPARSLPPSIVERVEQSIKFYHLDHPQLNEQRRLLALKLQDCIKQAHRLYARTLSGTDPDIEKAFGVFVGIIAKCLSERAELSMFARRMVKTHRNLPWIDEVLDAA